MYKHKKSLPVSKEALLFFKIKSAAQILKFLHIFAYDFGAYFH